MPVNQTDKRYFHCFLCCFIFSHAEKICKYLIPINICNYIIRNCICIEVKRKGIIEYYQATIPSLLETLLLHANISDKMNYSA